jgi:hypothetical protein
VNTPFEANVYVSSLLQTSILSKTSNNTDVPDNLTFESVILYVPTIEVDVKAHDGEAVFLHAVNTISTIKGINSFFIEVNFKIRDGNNV